VSNQAELESVVFFPLFYIYNRSNSFKLKMEKKYSFSENFDNNL